MLNNLMLPGLMILSVLSALPAGCKPKSADTGAPTTKPFTVAMTIGSETFNLEIADTDAEQQRGLMHRHHMPADHGMIFVNEDEEVRSFWMKNTFIPLDILYLDASGTVVAIKQMKPHDLRGVSSDRPAMYAVELNQGAALRVGVKVGDKLEVPEKARKPAEEPAAR
jgi:uncharacterized protein